MAQKLLVDTDIIIDDREDAKHPFFRKYLTSEKGLRVAVNRLETGDFHVPAKEGIEPVLVERKTARDIVSSIVDSRVWNQASRLRDAARELGAQPIIVLEGSLEKALAFRRISPTAVSRALEELQTSFGIVIVPTLDEKHTADWLAIKARPRKSPHSKSSRQTMLPLAYYKRPRRMTIDERILFVASSIAGPELGKRLLEKFGSLRNLVNASPRALEEVRGVGAQRASELFILFNKKWSPNNAREEEKR